MFIEPARRLWQLGCRIVYVTLVTAILSIFTPLGLFVWYAGERI